MRGAYASKRQLYLIIVPADGHQGCHYGETETSVRRRFYWAALGQAPACLYSITWGVGRKEQEGSEINAASESLLRHRSDRSKLWRVHLTLRSTADVFRVCRRSRLRRRSVGLDKV